jgi:hypothetical protein
LLQITVFEAAFECSILRFTTGWAYHLSFCFQFNQLVAAGAFRVNNLFELGPIPATVLTRMTAAILLPVSTARAQNHLSLLSTH